MNEQFNRPLINYYNEFQSTVKLFDCIPVEGIDKVIMLRGGEKLKIEYSDLEDIFMSVGAYLRRVGVIWLGVDNLFTHEAYGAHRRLAVDGAFFNLLRKYNSITLQEFTEVKKEGE